MVLQKAPRAALSLLLAVHNWLCTTGSEDQRAQPGTCGLVMKIPCSVQGRGVGWGGSTAGWAHFGSTSSSDIASLLMFGFQAFFMFENLGKQTNKPTN